MHARLPGEAVPPKSVRQVISLASLGLVFDFKLYTKPSFIAIFKFHLVSIYVGAKGVAHIPFRVVNLGFGN